VIQIELPKSDRYFHWDGWKPYTTKEDKLYDKHEVWDAVSVYNDSDGQVPEWARRNITEHNKVILHRDGKFALVNKQDVQFLD
jgi:hypothetical protein